MTTNGTHQILPVTLSITLNSNGQVSLTGPLANKVLVLGLLEMAKAVMRELDESAFQAETPQSSVVQ